MNAPSVQKRDRAKVFKLAHRQFYDSSNLLTPDRALTMRVLLIRDRKKFVRQSVQEGDMVT